MQLKHPVKETTFILKQIYWPNLNVLALLIYTKKLISFTKWNNLDFYGREWKEIKATKKIVDGILYY